MAAKETTILINAPVEKVYKVWAEYPKFPEFMSHVKDIKVTAPNESHWKVELYGRELEFDAKMTEMRENELISWESVSGIKNSGFIKFEPAAEGTKVTVHFNYMPETYPQKFAEKVGAEGTIEKQIQEDLDNLKSHVERESRAA